MVAVVHDRGAVEHRARDGDEELGGRVGVGGQRWGQLRAEFDKLRARTLQGVAVERLGVVPAQRHGVEEGGHGRGVGGDGVAVPDDLGGGEVELGDFLGSALALEEGK